MDIPEPLNEAERLLSLYDFKILDTLPEQSYDDITRIASIICNAPIALISFVDSYRQWFKSRVGLDIAINETPRDQAFCTYAIVHPNELMIVEDAQKDRRFASNPLVTGQPHIRFYAGAPLVTDEGHALGTLCVIDTKPNTIDPQQVEALRALARQATENLYMRRSLRRMNAIVNEKAS